MSHLLVISKVGSKWCSGQERDPELNIWCGSLKGGDREEERGMSSIQQVALPKIIIFVTMYNDCYLPKMTVFVIMISVIFQR